MLPRDLAHLVVLKQQPAVGENALRQREVGGHQECGPVNGMETDDLLADQMQVGGPEVVAVNFFAMNGAHIGGQRVEPDVENVLRLVGHGDAPFDRRPA